MFLSIMLYRRWNAPLPLYKSRVRSFGGRLEPRYIFRAGSLDQ